MRRKDEEKRENIKQAVMKLILEQGFHGASISKIAREANVSPATLYIYYQSKEEMLKDIYQEYADQIYAHLLENIHQDMKGAQFIETIIRRYYSYINEQAEVFYFVEQFAGCPSLADNCRETDGCVKIFARFDDMKEKGILRDIDNVIIYSLLFYPVKCISTRYMDNKKDAEAALKQLIHLLQGSLLAG